MPPLTKIQGHLKINWGFFLKLVKWHLTLTKNNKYTYLGLWYMSNCHKNSNNKIIKQQSTDSVFSKQKSDQILVLFICGYLLLLDFF